MKSFVSKNGINPFTILKKNGKSQIFLSIFLSFALLHLTIGCSYYQVGEMTTSKEEYIARIDKINSSNQYVIVHAGGNSWHLSDLVLDLESGSVKGTIAPISERHTYKKPRKLKGANRFKSKQQSPMDEVHFQLKTAIEPNYGTSVTIPFDEIESISLNKEDVGTEIATIFLGTVGVLVGITIIIALTKSSCPFAYVQTDKGWEFIGELYPGMITENMQKDDYLPLGNYNLSSDEFVVKVTNELKEIQYTDALELIALEHPENVEVLLDDNGVYYTFSNLQLPNRVVLDDQSESTNTALYKDGVAYTFNNLNDDMTNPLRSVVMEFDVPIQKNDGKLYLKAKNSLWLDYLFGEFNKKFGSNYSDFQKNQQERTGAESRQWISDQHIPLDIYIETDSGWELIKSINTVGPLKYRNLVVPIDSKYLTGSEVSVKLETGFMFWEVDYVGIDYTPNLELNKLVYAPHLAVDQEGANVTKLLTSIDRSYLVQPNIGDEVMVTFKAASLSNGNQSMFLRNRGYYNYVRDYESTPMNINTLRKFKEKDRFTLYSMMEYSSLIEHENDQYFSQNAN